MNTLRTHGGLAALASLLALGLAIAPAQAQRAASIGKNRLFFARLRELQTANA